MATDGAEVVTMVGKVVDRWRAISKYFIKISWGKGKLDRILFKTLN